MSGVAVADRTKDNYGCSTQLSSDYYGLGVRLGIYFTWLTSYLANTFVADEIDGGLVANTIFLLALLASIFTGSASGDLAVVDGLILMQLCAGYLFGALSIWGYRTGHYWKEGPLGIRHYGGLGTYARLILSAAISCYGIWFWTTGVQPGGLQKVYNGSVSPNDLRPGCEHIVTFFFAKLSVNGGIRIFYTIISASCAAWFGLPLIAAVIERARYARDIYYGRSKLAELGQGFTKYETGWTRQELRWMNKILIVFNLVWILWSAVMVEVTLNMNNVNNVLGPQGGIALPGQLLPMLIGAISLVRLLWIMFNERFRPKMRLGTGEFPTEGAESERPTGPIKTTSGLSTLSMGHPGIHRPIWQRYLVAWMPWLSRFDFWTMPAIAHHRSQKLANEGSSAEPTEASNLADPQYVEMQTAYKPSSSVDVNPYDHSAKQSGYTS